jgi:REP element-mobilizing transposase RayT
MPRRPRIELPGLTYHVTTHGVDGLPLFRDPEDRDVAVSLLAEEVELSKWICVEYAIMTTHYHVVLTLTNLSLSSGFQRLNARYAQYYNGRYGRRGHVFEGRFRDKMIETDAHRLEVVRYVARNPTRANMCRLPQHYPWSAYGSIIGFAPADPVIDIRAALEPFDGSRSAYRRFVEESDPRIRRGQAGARPQSVTRRP